MELPVFVVTLLACLEPARLDAGEAVVSVLQDGSMELVVGGRTTFATAGPIEGRDFEEGVESALGIWRFSREGYASTPYDRTVGREDGALVLEAPGSRTADLRVEAVPGGTRITLTPDQAHTSLAVPVRCDGTFHGFGAQMHVTDQKGEPPFDLFVGEQGIGRTGDLYFFTGDRHTSYFPMPWYIDARGFGVLFHTDHRTHVDLCSTDADVAWIEPVAGEPLAFTVFDGPTIPDVIRQLGDAIGRPTRPPDWAFTGAWMMSQGGPAALWDQLDAIEAAGIPTTAIWLQDWTGARQNLGGGYGVQYRWEGDQGPGGLYPWLPSTVARVKARGYRVLGYVNPFVDPALQYWPEMVERGMLPLRPESDEVCTFIGPRGDMTTADLSNPATQRYIARRLARAVEDVGLDGWMADFGEWLPLDCRIAEGDARAFHNRYPEAWQRITREVMDDLRPDGDWVMFARSGWTGVHEVAQIHWVGDQEADFEPTDGLPTVVPAMLNLGLSGQPFVTHDIAGFSGGPSTPELYRRWTELGAFTPIFRTHDGNDRANNHRWDTDPDTTAFFARFARVHEALGPDLLRIADEAATTGMPMVRHLLLHFPTDPEVTAISDQYMLGSELLVAPVLTEGATSRRLYLPEGDWYDVWTGTLHVGPAWIDHTAPIGSPPVFSRTMDRDDLRGSDMDDLDLLLERLRTDPDDPEGRAVLADWLLEHDQPEAVTWLELEDAHHRGVLDLEGRRRFVELDKRVDPDLRTRIARTRVENCTIELRAKFAYPCPERWAEMKPTADPRQRMCAVCDKAVHFVDTVEEARQHAVRDECVAISPAPERHPHDLRPPVPLPGTFMPPPRPPVPGKPFMPPTLDGIPPSPEPRGDVPSEEPPEPPKRSWWQRLFGS